MHRLELRPGLAGIAEGDRDTPVIDFAIDGVGLIDRIRAIAPQVLESCASGSGEGRFVGVTESIALEAGSPFLGERHHEYTDAYEGLVPVLVCADCSIPFCDGIWTRIKFSPDLVIWSGLGLVSDGGFQPLSGFGDFAFDRTEYQTAFARSMRLTSGGDPG